MKKLLTIALIAAMLACVCGCNYNNTDTDASSQAIDIEYEEIVVDENGNTITSSDSAIESENLTSDSQSADVPQDNVSSNTSGSSNDEIIIDYNTVVEVDICDDVIRSYLDATDPQRQFTILNSCQTMVLDYQTLPLTWKSDSSTVYKLYISENADFSNAHVSEINGTYENGMITSNKTSTICVPGKTYYWKVLGRYGDIALGGGKIYIKDVPVRWINIDGVDNVRDMGGWKTESGKTVKYGKIYRGSRFDNITDIGVNTIKALGIKTDIDIRSTAEWDSHGAVEKTGLKYYFFDTSAHYDYVLGSGDAEKEIRQNYPEMFKLLADESNYPIYLHCNFGNDRTGSMAFILNGLLGVTYEDLTRDYELTSFAFEYDNRWRGDGIGGTFGPNDLIQHNISNSNVDGRWGMMNKAFMESKYCTDGKLSTAIENFLLDRGVKQEHIDAYKKIMLG